MRLLALIILLTIISLTMAQENCLCTNLKSTSQVDYILKPTKYGHSIFSGIRKVSYYLWINSHQESVPDVDYQSFYQEFLPQEGPVDFNSFYLTQKQLFTIQKILYELNLFNHNHNHNHNCNHNHNLDNFKIDRDQIYRIQVSQDITGKSEFQGTKQAVAHFFRNVSVPPVMTLMGDTDKTETFGMIEIQAQVVTKKNDKCFIHRSFGRVSNGISQGVRIGNELFTSPLCDPINTSPLNTLKLMEELTLLEGMDRSSWTSVHLYIADQLLYGYVLISYEQFMRNYTKPVLTIITNAAFPNTNCDVMVEVTAHQDICRQTLNEHFNIHFVHSWPVIQSSGVKIGDKIIASANGIKDPIMFIPPYSENIIFNNEGISPAYSQYRQTINNMEKTLNNKGASFYDIVYVHDIHHYKKGALELDDEIWAQKFNDTAVHQPPKRVITPSTGTIYQDSNNNNALVQQEIVAFIGSSKNARVEHIF